MTDVLKTLDVGEIMALIPHRYPMLLIDRVDIVEAGKVAIGHKAVTVNEPFFPGHFPEKPIMPGVLIVEAMAQTSAVVTVEAMGEEGLGKLVYFMSIETAKFRKPVLPGDVLKFHVSLEKARGPIRRFACRAMVEDTLCAEASVQAMLADS